MEIFGRLIKGIKLNFAALKIKISPNFLVWNIMETHTLGTNGSMIIAKEPRRGWELHTKPTD